MRIGFHPKSFNNPLYALVGNGHNVRYLDWHSCMDQRWQASHLSD